MGRVTIKDIAEQAGVSKTIVSQYLNNNFKFMSEDTKNRIEKIVKELNYIPKNSARNLKFKKVKVINIIVANISSYFSTEVIKYIDKTLSSPTLQVLVSYSGDDGKKERRLIEQAIASDMDGIILFPTGENQDYYQMLYERQVPIVYVDRIPLGVEAFNCVLLDNELAIQTAIEWLVKASHTRIAFLNLPLREEITPRLERLNAFQKATAQYNQVLPSIISGSKEELAEKISNVLKNETYQPTAFIASNNTCLEVLLQVCKATPPQKQVDIVAIDGYNLFQLMDKIVLTIEHPIPEICQAIIDCLGIFSEEKQPQTKNAVYRFKPLFIDATTDSEMGADKSQ